MANHMMKTIPEGVMRLVQGARSDKKSTVQGNACIEGRRQVEQLFSVLNKQGLTWTNKRYVGETESGLITMVAKATVFRSHGAKNNRLCKQIN